MPVTRESIEKAKQQQRRERDAIYIATNGEVRITDDGRIILAAQS